MIYYLEEPADNQSGEVDFALPNPSDQVVLPFFWNTAHLINIGGDEASDEASAAKKDKIYLF